MKPKPDPSYTKPFSPYSSKSTTSSHTSLSLNKFQFSKPLGLLWKAPINKKRNASSENMLELTETCMFNEEIYPNSAAIFLESECQTEPYPRNSNKLIIENTDLIKEVKTLKQEIEEIKLAIKDLQTFQREVQGTTTGIYEPKEKDYEKNKKIQRPPLPSHRHTKSNGNL